MTIEELLAREGIRDTMARYSVAGDELETDNYVACFTDDAVLEFEDFPGTGDVRFEGRAAIREFAAGFFAAVKSGQAPLPGGFMRHHLTTCQIDFADADTASAQTYCIEFNRNGADASGRYRDTFRRVGDQWLLARRKWSPDK